MGNKNLASTLTTPHPTYIYPIFHNLGFFSPCVPHCLAIPGVLNPLRQSGNKITYNLLDWDLVLEPKYFNSYLPIWMMILREQVPYKFFHPFFSHRKCGSKCLHPGILQPRISVLPTYKGSMKPWIQVTVPGIHLSTNRKY